MTEVIPAILEDNYEDFRGQLARVANLVSMVQIDICDGKFTPHPTWPMQMSDRESVQGILNEEEGLPFWDSVDFEFDLMVVNAHMQFEFFTRLGAKRIVFHLEAEQDKSKFKEFLEGLDMYTRENIDIGLAINTTTDLGALAPFISYIDFVQCMGVEHIGAQDEPFDPRVLTQVEELHKRYPELIISIDGSVNENTAPLLVKAGATRLVVGSAILHSLDIRETIKEFENL